ncbi:MAG: hypothetical protein M3R11_06505 [Acidobacteriota bacterium]|nr:hypothetical protein [Acidobacteriota bacterium]
MDNQKFEIILDSLLKRSEEGNLDWKATANPCVYLLALKDSSISVDKYTEPIVRINFRDEKGNIIDAVKLHSSEKNFEKVNQIFDLARRKATNADETIDSILKQLNPDSIAA